MLRHTSKDMRWHKERDHKEGVLEHLADGENWKELDKQYPLFAKGARNVRLGLATDGFNPYGNLSNSYSIWSVMLVPYNLPSWRDMRKEFFMLSLLIPGPNSPGKDIDVYLQPLITELKKLWEKGVITFDVVEGDYFSMQAVVLLIINDLPAYGTISGYATKGYKTCLDCLDDTPSFGIRSKVSYMGARRYLSLEHPW